MILSQSLSGCPNIAQEFLQQANAARLHIQAELQAGRLPAVSIVEKDSDLSDLNEIVKRFQKFEDVVVFGTGGSSLGAQTICALEGRYNSKGPWMHFLDNVDPHTFDHFFASVEPESCGYIIVSKSGSTAETLCQALILLAKLDDKARKDNVIIITEDSNNPLACLAREYGIKILSHDPRIGGRYSVFSLVGLLPAMIAGFDAKLLRNGACSALSDFVDRNDIVESAALIVDLAETQGISCTVTMPYMDRLRPFSSWFRQLWAESLGKDGKGLTPITAVGAVDQHSQLQLYLDGPKDKFFTVIVKKYDCEGEKIPNFELTPYFSGKTMGDLIAAEQRATIETLINHKCPTRVLEVSHVNEESLGYLMMKSILETLLIAKMLNIDAFSQPAVEEGKILTKQYLSIKTAA